MKKENIWEIDEKYNKRIEAETLPIKEPPCKHCYYWQPHRVYRAQQKTGSLEFKGVQCCVNDNMNGGFYCFVKREEKK